MSVPQENLTPSIGAFFTGLFFALSIKGFNCFDCRERGEQLIAAALYRTSEKLPKLGELYGVDVSGIVPYLKPHPAYGDCRSFREALSIAHQGGTIYFRSDHPNRWYINERRKVPKWVGLPDVFCLAVAEEFIRQLG